MTTRPERMRQDLLRWSASYAVIPEPPLTRKRQWVKWHKRTYSSSGKQARAAWLEKSGDA